MGSAVQLDVTALSDEQLIDLETEIDRTLCAVFKISTVKPTLATEHKLGSAISKAWKAAARKGLTAPLASLLRGKVTQRKLDSFIKALGLKLAKPLTARQIKLAEGQLKKIYKIAKGIGAKEARVADFSFSLVDTKAITAINKHQVFWIGDFYNAHLSQRIRAVSEDVLLQRGFSQRQAGRELKKALAQEFGLMKGGGSRFALSVPARFAGNPDLYFRGVAATAAHQARTFGKMRVFSEVGVIKYRLTNPNDKRTGKICQQMHGQIFEVATGVQQMDDVLGAENPEDVKEIAPWLHPEKVKIAIGGNKRGSPDAAAGLAKAGMILPPFHMLCRTEPVVIA